MKKILLLSSLIALTFSCSNDAEQTTTQEKVNVETQNVTTTASRPLPPVENAIDEMFYEYVTSDSYINLQTKISTFNSKLKLPEGIEFESKAQLLNWINTNLSATNFTSIDEATLEWNDIVNVQSQEPAKFPEIYNFMVVADEALAVATYGKWLNLKYLPVSTSTNCDKNFSMCTNNANFRYFSMSRSFSQDPQIMAEAQADHQRHLERCRDSYIGCVKNG